MRFIINSRIIITEMQQIHTLKVMILLHKTKTFLGRLFIKIKVMNV